MGAPTKPRSRKTSAHRFSRDDVINAGVEITAANGLSALTLRAVSDHLGIQRPSLYHHLPGGHDELVSAVASAIGAEGDETADNTDTADDLTTLDVLERILGGAGSISRRYPGVLQYFLTAGRNEPTALAAADRSVSVLLNSEFAELVPEAFVIINAYVTGWAFEERPDRDAALSQGYQALGEVLDAAEQLDREQLLIDGLRALITGLKIGIDNESPRRARVASQSRGTSRRTGKPRR